MSMGDCPRCWNSVCNCGYMYENYTDDERLELACAVYNITDDYDKDHDLARIKLVSKILNIEVEEIIKINNL